MNSDIRLPLTKKQKKVLQFIIDFFSKNNYPPNYYEIKQAFKYKSPGHAYSIVQALVKKEYLYINASHHRSIRLTEISEDMPTSHQMELFSKRVGGK